MMKTRFIITLISGLLLFILAGCSFSLYGTVTPQPTTFVFPTLPPTSSPTQPISSATAIIPSATSVPTITPTLVQPISTTARPTTGVIINPGSPSGPYAVILVKAGDVLNIRSGPGASYPTAGTFSATATNAMRTGPSARVGDYIWVEVQNPSGGKGWVNSHYLAEYVSPATFCADSQVNNMISSLDTALTNSNGNLLASLVSPAHGMDVRLWRYGTSVIYDQEHTEWVFTSTYQVNWGPAPGSGLDTKGAFHEVVLPKLLDVFNASYTLLCNDPGSLGIFSLEPWPNEYANINYYNVYKPGSPGVELDWRNWLVGVEYVNGKPYIFALFHFQWEP